jgi:hypothetical protein
MSLEDVENQLQIYSSIIREVNFIKRGFEGPSRPLRRSKENSNNGAKEKRKGAKEVTEDTKKILVFNKNRLKTDYDDMDLDEVIEELTVQSNLLQYLHEVRRDIRDHVANLVDKKRDCLLRGGKGRQE